MKNRGPRWSFMAGIGMAALLACCGRFATPSMAVAAPADDFPLGKPAAMDFEAVTLQLQFAARVTEGSFRAVGARMLDVQTWAAAPYARADAAGFVFHPGGKRKGKAVEPSKAPAKRPAATTTVLAMLKPQADARLEIDSDAGRASVSLRDVEFDRPRKYLDGALLVRRVPSATRLAASGTDNDYPAAARGSDGSIWVAYVAYQSAAEPDMEAVKKGHFDSLLPHGNGDQIRLVRFDGREWSVPIPVTPPLLDLWKPAVAVDGAGRVWVAWSQNSDGHWGLHRRRYDPAKNQWSADQPVLTAPGAEINVVATTDSQGNVWWAWQGRRGKHFQIFLAGSDSHAGPIAVTHNAANHWAPAIAAGSQGSVYVAWDSYENGNYDVFLREFRGAEPAGPVIPVATTSDYEARASLAVDGQDRVWIAYEQGGANWGKDYGRMVPVAGQTSPEAIAAAATAYNAGEGRPTEPGDGVGTALYLARRVVVKCYGDGRMQAPACDPESAWEELPRPKSFARLAVGGDRRLWLLFRHHPLPKGVRETWAEYAMSYDGTRWSKPRILANSDNLLDNRPAIVPCGPDGAMAVYSSDCRLRGARNTEENGWRPLKNDLYAAILRGEGPVTAPKLVAAVATAAAVRPVHPRESQDIRRLRELRVECGGKTYQLARGEFHRHTEYTAHRDVDGALEDMWRYSQDAADMDWMGNADHDNGFGRQYAWWIIQKTVAIYHNPPWFIAPFTYERSVSYPNGHRNVIFARRGIRTLPRGEMRGDAQTGTPDTKMLYAYLDHFGGICASHTSATGMGTDWRDNNRLLEPVVEIYQGDRNNYECEGAPRGPEARDATAAMPEHERTHPQGFIWYALAKGYRFGFESSSDHISTHSSYAVALVETPGREAIVAALRARRCYAATDNIVLVVKCAGHLMGEEFAISAKPTLEIRALGSGPIAKLDIVRNNQYVYSVSPNTATLDLRWTDADPPAGGTNYYYVRIQQADTSLAWSSPLWIHQQPQ